MNDLDAPLELPSKAEVRLLGIFAHFIDSLLHSIDDIRLFVQLFIVFLKCFIIIELEALI